MYFVIAQKLEMAHGHPVEAGLDFDHPVAIYPDELTAGRHALTHAQNHGVMTLVVSEENLEALKKLYQDEGEDEDEEPVLRLNCMGAWGGHMEGKSN